MRAAYHVHESPAVIAKAQDRTRSTWTYFGPIQVHRADSTTRSDFQGSEIAETTSHFLVGNALGTEKDSIFPLEAKLEYPRMPGSCGIVPECGGFQGAGLHCFGLS